LFFVAKSTKQHKPCKTSFALAVLAFTSQRSLIYSACHLKISKNVAVKILQCPQGGAENFKKKLQSDEMIVFQCFNKNIKTITTT